MSQIAFPMSTLSLDFSQLRQIKSAAVGERSYIDRISVAFAFRLLGTPGLQIFSVLDELDHLEGMRSRSKTKHEAPFKRAPLTRFWHKHFASPRHISKNVSIRWDFEHGGNGDLTSLLERITRECGDEPDVWKKRLAHELVIGAVEDRAKRGFTGDWIVYAKHDGRNYYLDLASHDEATPSKAGTLYSKLEKGCAAEFPFLFAAAAHVEPI